MTDRDTARDSDVANRFRALREEDAERATPFGATLDRAYARRASTAARRLALGAAALIAAVLLLFVARTRSPRPANYVAAGRIITPTDFLLQLPGADLLRSVPEIGRVGRNARFLMTPTDRRTP